MIVRVTLIVLGLVVALPGSLLAQQGRARLSRMQEADAQLNRSYQQLMKTLPPPAKEQLRKAEHAWLDFVARNRAAFKMAAPRLGFSPSQCEDMEAAEFFNRGNQLSRFDARDQRANADAALHLARTDEELNVVYQRCLNTLTGPDAQRLRDAQEAWIVFRAAHGGFGEDLRLRITSNRIEQLNDFYIKTAREPFSSGREKADLSAPDPFERARK